MKLFELKELAYNAMFQASGLLGQLLPNPDLDRKNPELVRRVREDSLDLLRSALISELNRSTDTFWPFLIEWQTLFSILVAFGKDHPAVFEGVDLQLNNPRPILESVCALLECKEDEAQRVQACFDLCLALHQKIPYERDRRRCLAA